MEHRRLGDRGPTLPVVGMGTWKVLNVRGEAAERRAHTVVREAYEHGTRLFDSSPMYGEAERVLGDAVRPFRDDVFIATKVWARTRAEADEQIARSLGFFGGRVDLYQVHNLSLVEEVLPMLRRLKEEGTVGLVGLTHYAPAAFPELGRWAQEEGVDALQLPLNAAAREVEADLLPLAEKRGLAVLVMKPLGTGELVHASLPSGLLDRVREFGMRTPIQTLLKWVLSDPRVDVILPATGTPGHPTENVVAGDPPWLPDALREEISRAVRAGAPGPSST